jgi:hypothetical protein
MLIGIDPDVDKSGVAVKEDGKILLYSLKFWDLFEFLSQLRPYKVVIEGGWLHDKSNFRATKSSSISARIGKNVGSNHEVGRKIVEMCEYLRIDYEVVKPLQKKWKGRDGKITHEEIVKYFKLDIKRSNQEERDALLLII